jgi:hypothetical protein
MESKKINEFKQLEMKNAPKEISISILEARKYQGVKYWCSPDGLCELSLDSGTACGSEELLREMIDADTEVP